jgi:hypothetical protein
VLARQQRREIRARRDLDDRVRIQLRPEAARRALFPLTRMNGSSPADAGSRTARSQRSPSR